VYIAQQSLFHEGYKKMGTRASHLAEVLLRQNWKYSVIPNKISSIGCLGMILLAVGCGGSNQATIRVLSASPNENDVNVLIDSKTVSSDLAYGGASSYTTVNSGSRRVQIEPANSTTPIVDQTFSLGSSSASTVVMAGLAPNLTTFLLTDNNTAATSGTIMVRLVHAAPSMGPADVFVVFSGTSLTGLAPNVTSLAFGKASAYQTLTIPTTTTTTTGTFEVFFTQPGTTNAYLATGPISFTTGQVRTVVALNGLGGGFSAVTLADSN
jgi:hypothetical protein